MRVLIVVGLVLLGSHSSAWSQDKPRFDKFDATYESLGRSVETLHDLNRISGKIDGRPWIDDRTSNCWLLVSPFGELFCEAELGMTGREMADQPSGIWLIDRNKAQATVGVVDDDEILLNRHLLVPKLIGKKGSSVESFNTSDEPFVVYGCLPMMGQDARSGLTWIPMGTKVAITGDAVSLDIVVELRKLVRLNDNLGGALPRLYFAGIVRDLKPGQYTLKARIHPTGWVYESHDPADPQLKQLMFAPLEKKITVKGSDR